MRITHYPIKSCGGVDSESRRVAHALGPLEGDRAFMWVDKDGVVLSQRVKEKRQGNGGKGVPMMATIRVDEGESLPTSGGMPGITPPPELLRLSAPGLEPLAVQVQVRGDSSAAPLVCNLWEGDAPTSLQNSAAGAWFDRLSGLEGCQLVMSVPGNNGQAVEQAEWFDWRPSRPLFHGFLRQWFTTTPVATASAPSPPVPLDDGGTILMVTESSLLELNRRMCEAGLPEVSIARFRPNLVVGGMLDGGIPLPPHAEDEWLEIWVGPPHARPTDGSGGVNDGGIRFRVERPCTRCSLVHTDQETGAVDATRWLSRVLAKYRFSHADAAYEGWDKSGTKFGLYLTPLNAGILRQGDAVVVTVRKKSEGEVAAGTTANTG